MTGFYGIQTGTIPGCAEAGGGTFMGVRACGMTAPPDIQLLSAVLAHQATRRML